MRIDRHSNTDKSIPIINAYDQSDQREADHRFYAGKLWRNVRRYHLAHHPLCALCGLPASIVDHVVDRKSLPPEDWYDPNNLQSLCPGCHNAKRKAHGAS